MKTIILGGLALLVAVPALACQGVIGEAVGAYGAKTKTAVLESIEANKVAETNPAGYAVWLGKMVSSGQLVFVPAGTRLCAKAKAAGLVRAEVKGETLYLTAVAVSRI